MEEFLEPKQMNEGMRQGLARMYGDTFMREYLQNIVAIYKSEALKNLANHKDEVARDALNRAKAYELLIIKGKEYFTHFEKIREQRSKLQAKEEVKL